MENLLFLVFVFYFHDKKKIDRNVLTHYKNYFNNYLLLYCRKESIL